MLTGYRRRNSSPRSKVKRICLETGSVDKLKKLVRTTSNLELKKMRFDGITALQLSVSSGFSDVTSFLVEECGVDVNECSDTGFTALHVACDRDMVDVANYLVVKGARLDAEDSNGRTPLDVCGSIGLVQIGPLSSERKNSVTISSNSNVLGVNGNPKISDFNASPAVSGFSYNTATTNPIIPAGTGAPIINHPLQTKTQSGKEVVRDDKMANNASKNIVVAALATKPSLQVVEVRTGLQECNIDDKRSVQHSNKENMVSGHVVPVVAPAPLLDFDEITMQEAINQREIEGIAIMHNIDTEKSDNSQKALSSSSLSPSELSVHQKIMDFNMKSKHGPMPASLLSAIRGKPRRRSTTSNYYQQQYEATCYNDKSVRASFIANVGHLTISDDSCPGSVASESPMSTRGMFKLWERVTDETVLGAASILNSARSSPAPTTRSIWGTGGIIGSAVDAGVGSKERRESVSVADTALGKDEKKWVRDGVASTSATASANTSEKNSAVEAVPVELNYTKSETGSEFSFIYPMKATVKTTALGCAEREAVDIVGVAAHEPVVAVAECGDKTSSKELLDDDSEGADESDVVQIDLSTVLDNDEEGGGELKDADGALSDAEEKSGLITVNGADYSEKGVIYDDLNLDDVGGYTVLGADDSTCGTEYTELDAVERSVDTALGSAGERGRRDMATSKGKVASPNPSNLLTHYNINDRDTVMGVNPMARLSRGSSTAPTRRRPSKGDVESEHNPLSTCVDLFRVSTLNLDCGESGDESIPSPGHPAVIPFTASESIKPSAASSFSSVNILNVEEILLSDADVEESVAIAALSIESDFKQAPIAQVQVPPPVMAPFVPMAGDLSYSTDGDHDAEGFVSAPETPAFSPRSSFQEAMARHQLLALAAASPSHSIANDVEGSPGQAASPVAQLSAGKDKRVKTLSYIVSSYCSSKHGSDSDGESITSGWSWSGKKAPDSVENQADVILGLAAPPDAVIPPYTDDKAAAEAAKLVTDELAAWRDDGEEVELEREGVLKPSLSMTTSVSWASALSELRHEESEGDYAKRVVDCPVHDDTAAGPFRSPRDRTYSPLPANGKGSRLHSPPLVVHEHLEMVDSADKPAIVLDMTSLDEEETDEMENLDDLDKSDINSAVELLAELRAGGEERGALLRRIALLEAQSLELQNIAQCASIAVADAASQLEESAKKHRLEMSLLTVEAESEAVNKEQQLVALVAQLEIAKTILSQAGEDAKESVAARNDLECRALLAMGKLEEELKVEQAARLLAEERLRTIESETELFLLLKKGNDEANLTSSTANSDESHTAQLCITSAPTLASLQRLYKSLGEVLEDQGCAVSGPYNALQARLLGLESELDSRTQGSDDEAKEFMRDGLIRSSSVKSEGDLLLSFDEIYPPLESKCPRVPVHSTKQDNGDDEWEAFEITSPKRYFPPLRLVPSVANTGAMSEGSRGCWEDNKVEIKKEEETLLVEKKGRPLNSTNLLFCEENPLSARRRSLERKRAEVDSDRQPSPITIESLCFEEENPIKTASAKAALLRKKEECEGSKVEGKTNRVDDLRCAVSDPSAIEHGPIPSIVELVEEQEEESSEPSIESRVGAGASVSPKDNGGSHAVIDKLGSDESSGEKKIADGFGARRKYLERLSFIEDKPMLTAEGCVVDIKGRIKRMEEEEREAIKLQEKRDKDSLKAERRGDFGSQPPSTPGSPQSVDTPSLHIPSWHDIQEASRQRAVELPTDEEIAEDIVQSSREDEDEEENSSAVSNEDDGTDEERDGADVAASSFSLNKLRTVGLTVNSSAGQEGRVRGSAVGDIPMGRSPVKSEHCFFEDNPMGRTPERRERGRNEVREDEAESHAHLSNPTSPRREEDPLLTSKGRERERLRNQNKEEQVKDVQIKNVQSKDVQIKNVQSKDVQIKNMQSKDVQIKNVQSKDVQSKDVQSKDVQTKNMPSKDVQTKNMPSKDVQIKNMQSKDVQIKNVQSKDVQIKNVQSKDVQTKNMPSKDVQSKNMQSKDVQIKNVQSKDVQIKNVQIEDVQSKDVQSKNVQIEDVQSKNMQSKDVQSKDVQIKDVQNGARSLSHSPADHQPSNLLSRLFPGQSEKNSEEESEKDYEEEDCDSSVGSEASSCAFSLSPLDEVLDSFGGRKLFQLEVEEEAGDGDSNEDARVEDESITQEEEIAEEESPLDEEEEGEREGVDEDTQRDSETASQDVDSEEPEDRSVLIGNNYDSDLQPVCITSAGSNPANLHFTNAELHPAHLSESVPITDDSESVQNVNDSESVPITDNSESVQNFDDSESVPITDDSESVQNVDDSESVPITDDSESVQNVDDNESVQSMDDSALCVLDVEDREPQRDFFEFDCESAKLEFNGDALVAYRNIAHDVIIRNGDSLGSSRVERNVMMKMERSLGQIFHTLETLRLRSRLADLSNPHPQSLLQSALGSKMEAFRRFKAYTPSARDLLALGSLPPALGPLLALNDPTLWTLYCCYCPPGCKVLSIPSDDARRCLRKTRGLTSEGVWRLFSDFDLCSDASTRSDMTQNLSAATRKTLAACEQPHSLLLSFEGFLRLLWRLSVRSPLVPHTASPRSRLLALLTHMDRSMGRALNEQRQRQVQGPSIPPFHLEEQSSEQRAGDLLAPQ